MKYIFKIINFLAKIINAFLPSKKIRKRVKNFVKNIETNYYLKSFKKASVNANWVVFWDGVTINGLGDNIKPIYEEFKKRYPNWKYIFIVADKNVQKNFAVQETVVLKDDVINFNKYIQCSKYYITNMYGLDIDRKKDQIWIDTGHGTPFKTIGFLDYNNVNTPDIERTPVIKGELCFNAKALQNQLLIDAACTSFVYKDGKEIMDRSTMFITGYPRSDILFNHAPDDVKKIKKNLNIPEDKKVILYTPTYRTYGDKFSIELNLDMDLFNKKLGDEYILLIRAHYFAKKFVNKEGQEIDINCGSCMNVCLYPEVSDLYLISDIMISDYSSTAIDFCCLNKPVIFYIYDYDNYEKERGFNIDFKAEMPGPLVYDMQGLIEAIKNAEANMPNFSQKCQKFLSKYAPVDDGHSSERTVDLIMKLNKDKNND